MSFIKWLRLKTVCFEPGVMTPSLARFVLGPCQKLAAEALMANRLGNGKSIKIHPATRNKNVNTSKDLIVGIAHKDAQTLRAPHINTGVIIRTNNGENGINICRRRVLDNDQVVIGSLLAHRGRLLWLIMMTHAPSTTSFTKRSGTCIFFVYRRFCTSPVMA